MNWEGAAVDELYQFDVGRGDRDKHVQQQFAINSPGGFRVPELRAGHDLQLPGHRQ